MEDDFNDFSELSAGDTSIALRRCFAQVAAERDSLRAEVERIREEAKTHAAILRGSWEEAAQRADAATARAEAAASDANRFEEYYQAACRDLSQQVDEIKALENKLESTESLLVGMLVALAELTSSLIHVIHADEEMEAGFYCHGCGYEDTHSDTCSVRKAKAALALTPASAGNRIKAEAYLELCDGLLFFVDADVKQMLRMEAARLTAEAEKEAANGR